MSTKRTRLAAALMVLSAMFIFVPAGGAYANTSRANTDTFSFSGTYAFPSNSICIKYSGSASLTYNAVRYGPTSSGYVDYWLENVKLTTTSVTYSMVRYDSVSHACTSTGVKWKKLEAAQHWAGYGCSYNPSISVQFPFAVGASFWPSCSASKTQATYKSIYDSANGIAGPTQTQGTTNDQTFARAHLVYQPDYVAKPTKGSCYGVWISMHWYVGSADNTRNFSSHSLCTSPVW